MRSGTFSDVYSCATASLAGVKSCRLEAFATTGSVTLALSESLFDLEFSMPDNLGVTIFRRIEKLLDRGVQGCQLYSFVVLQRSHGMDQMRFVRRRIEPCRMDLSRVLGTVTGHGSHCERPGVSNTLDGSRCARWSRRATTALHGSNRPCFWRTHA